MKKRITNIIQKVVKDNLDDVFFVIGGLCITSSAFTLSVALGLFILGAFFMVLSYLISR